MGMFDKDKEIGRNLVSVFSYGDEFALHGATIAPEPVQTDLGPARKSILTVSRLDKPGDRFEVTTLASAIADKVAEAEGDDFPAVVQLLKVSGRYGNDATVLQFVRPLQGGNNR